MKQLILTFFAVILCYSLFFDRKDGKPAIEEINYIKEAAQISDFCYIKPGTMNFISQYNHFDDWHGKSMVFVLKAVDDKPPLIQAAN